MQGIINFDGTLSGSIAGGGGGGGSEVTITPVLTEGTKIADYSIDGNTGELYAPEAGDTVDVIPTLNVGDKVADIEVNGVNKALYSRSYGYANDMHDTNSETIGGFQKGSNITPIKVKAVSYVDQSGVDGETIGVLSVGDTKYAVKQKKVNSNIYSSTEVIIGLWMGEPLYRRVWTGLNTAINGNSWVTLSGIDVTNWREIVKLHAYTMLNDKLTTVALTEYRVINGGVDVSGISSTFDRIINVAYIEYTKSTD